MALVDTHCHLQDGVFDEDRDEVIERALAVCDWLVIVSDDIANSTKAAELSGDRIYFAAGCHPYHAVEVFDHEAQLRELLAHPRNVSLGEIGLDYFKYCETPRDVQAKSFRKQLDIACELNKPVIIHDRDAHEDCLEILRDYASDLTNCVMHCFSGGPELAEQCLALGFHLSFTGNVTYPKAQLLRDAASVVPMDRLMVETDSPYLSPQPKRGKRCEPAYVQHTAEALAELKGLTLAEFTQQTTDTATQFFGIAP